MTLQEIPFLENKLKILIVREWRGKKIKVFSASGTFPSKATVLYVGTLKQMDFGNLYFMESHAPFNLDSTDAFTVNKTLHSLKENERVK